MKQYTRLFVASACLLRLLWPLDAAAHALPPAVADALKKAGVPLQNTGIVVQQVSAAEPLLSQGAERSMNPASTMKLLTTYAALELLGPDYIWKTEAYAGGSLQGDKLNGDLILKGYGDPALTLEQFWLLLRDLRSRGVREISGGLVLDRQQFKVSNNDPGAFDREPYKPYNVVPDALLVNFKAIRFRFVPDAGTGAPRILVDPVSPQLHVFNQLHVAAGDCGDWHETIAPEIKRTGSVVTVVFSGGYPVACGEKLLHLSLLDSNDYVYALFRQLWEESGGILRGGVSEGAAPSTAHLLAVHESNTLAEAVRDTNKFSNNVMARQLLLTIGGMCGNQATIENGAATVQGWLAAKGLHFPELVIENGAGLSRIERISAQHMSELLLAAYRSPVFSELESSLPLVSVDGTMKKRMLQQGVAGSAHIKSGSLEGVKTIAGYVLDKKGRRMVVVFMVNHAHAAAAKEAQDALLEWVYQRE